MSFKKTDRQKEALALLNSHEHIFLYGGSRSGKTWIIIRNIFLRAIKKPSTHLIVRRYAADLVSSIILGTIPEVLDTCFPGLEVKEHRQDGYYTVPTVCGGVSQVWVGGTDDKRRIGKILGNQYSTVFINECTDIPWEAVVVILTRLAETSGLENRVYYDCNPASRKQWAYKFFMENQFPDGSKHTYETASLLMNPTDNLDNLDQKYLDILSKLPPKQRQRFLEGLFLDDVEGALWTQEMVSQAKSRPVGDIDRIVVAVDPAVTDNPNSDETGIVVVGASSDAQSAVVLGDYSLKASPEKWAKAVVEAYEKHNANIIIAETNQGGDLVVNIMRNINPRMKIEKVHASVGKVARADPVSMLYEQGKISHVDGLDLLESELTDWVPGTGPSPNRLDALVYGVSHLMLKKPPSRYHGAHS